MRIVILTLLTVLSFSSLYARPLVLAKQPSFDGISRETVVVETLKSVMVNGATTKRFADNAQRSCVTMVALEAARNYDGYSQASRDTLDRFFARPIDNGDYGADTVEQYLSVSGNFTIHYTTTGTHAVSTTDSEGPGGAAGGDGIPDYVNKTADYYDDLSGQILALGYPLPPSDSGLGNSGSDDNPDDSFDVFIKDTMALGAYGFAVSDPGGVSIMSNSAPSYMEIDNDLNDDDLAETVAHEFHHAVQFGMAYWADMWYFEATSTWIEAFLLPDDTYPLFSMTSFFANPIASLSEPSDMGYSHSIWNQYLEESRSDAVILDIWTDLTTSTSFFEYSIFPAFETVLGGTAGLQTAFVEFNRWNLDTSMYTRFAGSIPVVNSTLFTADEATISGAIGALGARYSEIAVTTDPILYLAVNGGTSTAKVSFAKKDSSGNFTFSDIVLDNLGQTQTTVPDVSSTHIDTMYIIASNTSSGDGTTNDIQISYSKNSMPELPGNTNNSPVPTNPPVVPVPPTNTSSDQEIDTADDDVGGSACLIKSLLR